MNIGFTKMHGLGNDFVVIENMNGRITLAKEQIIFLCDRFKGIGADGVILIEKSDKGDCFMNYYNADGSVAEMCGNGVRCVAKFLKDDILKDKVNFKIDTRAGMKDIEFMSDGTFSVNMGKPMFSSTDFPGETSNLEGLSFNFVSVGNPHAVALVESLETYDLSLIGPKIENDKIFPNKINVELVEKKYEKEYKVKVWERGCGATLACGTGACAVYAIIAKDRHIDGEIKISLPGGNLFLGQNTENDIIMRGPAESVYNGMIYV